MSAQRAASRRRVPWWVLALLFVVVPVVEIYVLIQVGQVIGAWWTVLILVGDGFLGGWLMKREGTRALRSLREALREGRLPGRELADGALVLVGGTLLLTPGFVTDAVGLLLVLPFTRPLARQALTRFVTARLLVGPGGQPSGFGAPGFGGTGFPGSGFPGSGFPGTGFGGTGASSANSGRRDMDDPPRRRRPGPGVVRGEVVDDPPEGGPAGS